MFEDDCSDPVAESLQLANTAAAAAAAAGMGDVSTC